MIKTHDLKHLGENKKQQKQKAKIKWWKAMKLMVQHYYNEMHKEHNEGCWRKQYKWRRWNWWSNITIMRCTKSTTKDCLRRQCRWKNVDIKSKTLWSMWLVRNKYALSSIPKAIMTTHCIDQLFTTCEWRGNNRYCISNTCLFY
jgi:hypothetical protein